VGNAIIQVKPRAVDVMTGVETPKAKGIKDFEKVEAFIQAVRAGRSGIGTPSSFACVSAKDRNPPTADDPGRQIE